MTAKLVWVVIVLFYLQISAHAQQSSCPTSPYSVTTTLTFDKPVEAISGAIDNLHTCFNIKPCQIYEYSIGQCGGSKMIRVTGVQEASSVDLGPGGCSNVYNCDGVLVTSEVYNAILAHTCMPYDNIGNLVGVCEGVVVPQNVLQKITCAHCNGADWCRTHCVGYVDCVTASTCDKARHRHLLASDLPCSVLKVTLNAGSQEQGTLVKTTLEGPAILRQLNYCLRDANVTSAGPTSRVPPSHSVSIL